MPFLLTAAHIMPSTHQETPRQAPFSFQSHWIAELVRLRESRWGPLDDASESRRARALGGTLSQRILLRAKLLAQREGLDEAVFHWQRLARLALYALLLLGLLAGGSAALAALGNNNTPVNLAMALFTLLGLHALTFLFWLASLCLPGHGDNALLGKAWLWLAKRLARGPNHALAPAALAEWLGRHGLLRWVFGSISHLTWVFALLGQIAVLLLVLAAKRYAFSWETTLLPPGFFDTFTQWLGWLPAHIGFAVPSSATVQASINLPANNAATHVQWSSWLLGCVVVYGLLPRLLALGWCLLTLRKRLPLLALDEQQAAYAALRPRLMPVSEHIEPDAPPGPADAVVAITSAASSTLSNTPLVLALELSDESPWPPARLPGNIQAGPNITQRAQRETLLRQLHRQPLAALLLAVDGNQTPDRGTLAFIQEIHALTGQMHIALQVLGDIPARREAQWRDALTRLPEPTPQVHQTLATGLSALGNTRVSTVEVLP